MGASVKSPEVQKQIKDLQEDTKLAGQELDTALLDSAVDAAGIVDPTPISDAIGLVRSASSGDWLGAGLSLISMIPYAGDAIGKSAKAARVLKRINDIRKRIADNALKARQIVINAVKKDAAAIRAKRAADKALKIDDGIVSGCPVGGNKFGTQSPKNGWTKGERGTGNWEPGKSGLDPDKVKEIESVTKGKPVKFNDGYPDFSDYTHKVKNSDGVDIDARVEIELDRTGDRAQDFKRAREAMAQKMGVDKYHEPPDYTWHHREDGTTMELVPSALHNNVPHSGGVSLAKDPAF